MHLLEQTQVLWKEALKMVKTISIELYYEARNNYRGWCSFCQDFTRECTEPDAERYECPKCGWNRVMGAEQALISGEILLEEDDNE